MKFANTKKEDSPDLFVNPHYKTDKTHKHSQLKLFENIDSPLGKFI